MGGNIGVPLLDRLDEMRPESWAVLEISHTQLEIFGRGPHIAVVTNIAPSHADRYPDMGEYIALKKRIFAGQGEGDYTVLNYDDPVTKAMAEETSGQAIFFSRSHDHGLDGAFLRDGWVMARIKGREERVVSTDEIKLLGEHNLENVLAASAIAALCGVVSEVTAQAIASFRGVEHRLEWVRCLGGVDFYNDSIATTPHRSLAGLRVFSRPVVLIAGGRGKQLPLDELAAEAIERCRAVVLYGESAPYLERAIEAAASRECGLTLIRVDVFQETVAAAREAALPGDVVLLSPACTSFDSFANFEERGREFKHLVGLLKE
ncbi:MAG: murD [Dehalococcoidia bacterium]|nr:murD [Dehalococcoidia bacterium]